MTRTVRAGGDGLPRRKAESATPRRSRVGSPVNLDRVRRRRRPRRSSVDDYVVVLLRRPRRRSSGASTAVSAATVSAALAASASRRRRRARARARAAAATASASAASASASSASESASADAVSPAGVVDVVAVEHRRSALPGRHATSCPVSTLLNENGIFNFRYRPDDTASHTSAEIEHVPAEMLFPRCACAQRRSWSFTTLPVAFSGSSSRNST